MHTEKSSPKNNIAFWPLLLPLLLFLPGLTGFPYPSPEAEFSDLTIMHYPNAIYLKRVLLEVGTIPLWSPTILSGYPFAANPLSGLWYPPGWLALLLPLPLGFNLLVALHLLWGGVGMVRLLYAEGLSYRSALLGALAFECIPKLFAHYGAGHLTLLYAIPWTPWLLFFSRRSKSRCRPAFAQPGVILALIFLADPRWGAYAGLTWLTYAIAHSQINDSAERAGDVNGDKQKSGSALQSLSSNLKSLLFQTFLATLLSAPLLLPLLEYTCLTTRSNMSMAESLIFSLPPERLLGLILPDFGGFHEWMLYPGGVILVLVVVAIFRGGRRTEEKFWFWVGLLTLSYALGTNIPLLPYLTRLPGLSWLRVPSRALFLTSMAFAAVAAYGVETLLGPSGVKQPRRVKLTLVGLVALVATLAAGMWFVTQEFSLNFVWGAGAVLAGSLWAGGRMGGRIPPKTGYLVLLGLALIDWGMMDASVLTFRPKDQVSSEQSEVATYLASQEGHFRVYSPSYSLPQHMAAIYGLELADGVDPMQLTAYAAFMDRATGVPRSGYGVTIPPFAGGDPPHDNAAYSPDPALLGLLNVRFVVAEYDLPIEGLLLRTRFGETRVYENTLSLPRAWVQPVDADPCVDIKGVEISEWGPNQITVRGVGGPGLLVLSEIAYPGWQVTVEGEPVRIETVAGILRSVRLERGKHNVVFVFRPLSVYLGMAGFMLGVALWVVKCLLDILGVSKPDCQSNLRSQLGSPNFLSKCVVNSIKPGRE